MEGLNDFFVWNISQPFTSEPHIPLTEAEQDELFDLFDNAGLPSTAMNAEMADGYMTGCYVSPDLAPAHFWLEGIFGQPTLPICADPAQQERLLQLLLRRYKDIQLALRHNDDSLTPDNVFMPLSAEVSPQDCIRPYQLDAEGNRLGHWELKDWAEGFFTAIREDDAWEELFEDREAIGLLTPLTLFHVGFNPENSALQIEDEKQLVPLLITCVYQLRTYWRNKRNTAYAPAAAPFVRESAKVGRNDPCTCGSGKKFKKCCGAL